MADGGGITLRMSLQGAEQIRAQLASIGPEGSKMARELDRAMRTPTAGMKALDTGVGEAKAGLANFAGQAGAVGNVLQSFGPWGLAAAAGIGAVGIVLAKLSQETRAAMAFADEIDDAAQKINIGTSALQEYRFAMTEVGGEAKDADAAIDGFQKKMGEALAGGRSKKWFAQLGISPEDLRSFGDTETALKAVLDRISELGTEAERAAVAEKLGLGPMVALARMGSGALDDLRQKAQDIGYVMSDELVAKGAEANQKFETMSQIIDVQMKSAFVGLSDEVLTFTGHIADALQALNNFIAGFSKWKADTDAINGQGFVDQLLWGDAGKAIKMAWDRQVDGSAARARNAIDHPQYEDPDDPALLRQRMAMENRGRRAPSGGARELSSSGGGGRSGPSKEEREAEQRRKEAERALERLTQEELAAERENVQAEADRIGTAQARADAALSMLQIDERAKALKIADLTASIEAGGLSDSVVKERLEQLAALKATVRADREAVISERHRNEERESLLAAEKIHAETQLQILDLASGEARTATERRDIQARILEITQRRERAELEAAIASEKDAIQKQALVDRLARLPEIQAGQTQAMLRQTAGPLEAWRNSQSRSAGEASEWVQGQAIDALDGLNGGLLDALKNADSASDAFDRMGSVAVSALDQIVSALAKVALQRMLIEPLINGLFGSGQAGGSQGLLGSFIQNFTGQVFGRGSTGGSSSPGISMLPNMTQRLSGMPGHGRGGVNGAAGLRKVGEFGFELMDLPVGARIYDNDRSQQILSDFDRRMSSGAGMGGGGLNLGLTVINKGEPMKASMSQGSDGKPTLTLEPFEQLMEGKMRKMGADGSLAAALGTTPRPRRR